MFISLLLLLFIMLLFYMNMKTEQKYPLTDNDPYNTSECIHNYLLNYGDTSQTRKLIYNRVPKCGSCTMHLAIAILGNILNYHVTFDQFRRMTYWIDSAHERDKIRKTISALPKPWIYIRHMYFLDFNTSSTVYYVNLIRDPVQRLVSWFYYIRQKYRIARYDNPPDEVTLTFDECVQKIIVNVSNHTYSRLSHSFVDMMLDALLLVNGLWKKLNKMWKVIFQS